MSDHAQQERKTEARVERQFVERRSTRAFSSEPVGREALESVFEAARWAPSCFNDQPWLFVYGAKDEDHAKIAALLAEGNRSWAATAPVLGVVFARRHFAHNGKPNRWGAYDSGAAAMSLALQAHALGLAVHFMGGFDAQRALEELHVPAGEYEAMAAFALGRPGDAGALSEELRERESPTGRKPLREVAFEGVFETE